MASDDAGAAASTNVLAVVTLDAVGTLAMVLFAFDGPLPEALIPRCPPPACCPPGTGPPPASCAAGGGTDGLQQEGDAENCLPAGQCVEGLWCSALGDILLLMVVRAFLAVSAVTGTRWLTSNCGLASTMVWHWLCTAYMAAKSLVAMDFAVRHVQGLTIVHGPVSVDLFTLLAAALYSACIGWLQFSLVWKYRLAFRVFDPRLELPGMPFDSRVDGQGIGTWFESFYIQQRPRFDRSREPLLHPYDAFPLPPPARPEAPPEAAASAPAPQQQRRQQRRRQRQQRQQLADEAEEVPGEGRRLLEKSRSAPDSTGS